MKYIKNVLLIIITSLLTSIIIFNFGYNTLFVDIKIYNIQTVIISCFISTLIISYRKSIKSRSYIIGVLFLVALSAFTTMTYNISVYNFVGKDYEFIQDPDEIKPIYISMLEYYAHKGKDVYSKQLGMSVLRHIALTQNDKVQIHNGSTLSDCKAITFFDDISPNDYIVYELYSSNRGFTIPIGFSLFDKVNKKFVKSIKTSDIENLITSFEDTKSSKLDTYKYNFLTGKIS